MIVVPIIVWVLSISPTLLDRAISANSREEDGQDPQDQECEDGMKSIHHDGLVTN